jgi:hypothetical protein
LPYLHEGIVTIIVEECKPEAVSCKWLQPLHIYQSKGNPLMKKNTQHNTKYGNVSVIVALEFTFFGYLASF